MIQEKLMVIPGEDLYAALEALEQGLAGDSDDNDRICIQCSKAIIIANYSKTPSQMSLVISQARHSILAQRFPRLWLGVRLDLTTSALWRKISGALGCLFF